MTSNIYVPPVVEFDQESESMVDAKTKTRPFFQLGDDGEPMPYGRIGLTDLGSGATSARKMFYISPEHNKEHPLGTMTKAFKIHDNFQVLRPIFDAGFTVKGIQHFTRGGAGTITMLTHPKIEYPDFLKWDDGLYEGEHLPLNPGILCWLDAREGRAYKFEAGFIRWYCTNGIVSKYLGLGNLHQSHKDVDLTGIHEFANRVAEKAYEWKQPPAFSPKSLEFPRDIILKQVMEPGSWMGQPNFVQEPMASMDSILPGWGWEALGEQLNLMIDNSPEINVMDIVNAVTNLNRGRKTARIYSKLTRMTTNIMRLTELGAWKASIDFPKFYTEVE